MNPLPLPSLMYKNEYPTYIDLAVMNRNVTMKRNNKGETPLHKVCSDEKGSIETVIKFLHLGHNPNVYDYAKLTPLHDAVLLGRNDIVKELIVAGALLDPTGPNGSTPLHYAASHSEEITEFLVEAGSDVKRKDFFGQDASSCATNDTMKALLTMNLRFPKKFVQKRKACEPCKIYVAPFSNDQRRSSLEMMRKRLRKVGISTHTTFSSDVTHCIFDDVVECNEYPTKPDLLIAYLMAIANGCYVLNYEWFKTTAIRRYVQPFEWNEITELQNGIPNGAMKSRMSASLMLPRLFEGCEIHILPQGVSAARMNDLKKLVHTLGATYLTRCPNPEMNAKYSYSFHAADEYQKTTSFIFYQYPQEIKIPHYNMKHLKLKTLMWFFKCVVNFAITDDFAKVIDNQKVILEELRLENQRVKKKGERLCQVGGSKREEVPNNRKKGLNAEVGLLKPEKEFTMEPDGEEFAVPTSAGDFLMELDAQLKDPRNAASDEKGDISMAGDTVVKKPAMEAVDKVIKQPTAMIDCLVVRPTVKEDKLTMDSAMEIYKVVAQPATEHGTTASVYDRGEYSNNWDEKDKMLTGAELIMNDMSNVVISGPHGKRISIGINEKMKVVSVEEEKENIGENGDSSDAQTEVNSKEKTRPWFLEQEEVVVDKQKYKVIAGNHCFQNGIVGEFRRKGMPIPSDEVVKELVTSIQNQAWDNVAVTPVDKKNVTVNGHIASNMRIKMLNSNLEPNAGQEEITKYIAQSRINYYAG